MKRRKFITATTGAALGAACAVATGTGMARASSGRPARIFLKREKNTAAALKSALEGTGDLSFIERGDSVLIKPCVNSGNNWPATSSPELISLLVRTLKDRGAGEIIVADTSALSRNTTLCMERCGIMDAAKNSGAKVIIFRDEGRYVELDAPKAKAWNKKILYPEIVRDVDRIINLPTVRTHMIAGFTMSIKNWVGLIPWNKRRGMHIPIGFPQRMGELAALRQADLILMDGRQSFVAGGPDSGKLAKPGLFAAGTDPVAMDVLGLAILAQFGAGNRISGASPWKNPIISRAAGMSDGVRSGADIKIDSQGVEEIRELERFMEVPER